MTEKGYLPAERMSASIRDVPTRYIQFFLILMILFQSSCQHSVTSPMNLAQASAAADFSAIRRAIEAGESPNPPPEKNETPLGFLLHQYKKSDIMKKGEIHDAAIYLLEQGADPNALHHGFTPLQIATGQKSTILVSMLIKHGGDPSRETVAGLAPIWQAVYTNNFRVGYELLRGNANPNSLNTHGQTPLEYLRSQGYIKTRLMIYLRRFGGH